MAKIDAEFDDSRPKRKRIRRLRRRPHRRSWSGPNPGALKRAERELKLLDAIIEFFRFERRDKAAFLKRWQKQTEGK